MKQALLACAVLAAAPGTAAADSACIAKDAAVDTAQLTDTGAAVCLADAAKSCWAVDFATKAWTPRPPGSVSPDAAEPAAAAPAGDGSSIDIDDKHTAVKVCATKGSCISIPVSFASPDTYSGVGLLGTTYAVVWESAAAQIFDAKTGKKVSTIKAWPAFKGAMPDLSSINWLPGDEGTVEVIGGTGGDSVVASLFSTRTGKLLRGVGILGRYPSSIDEGAPLPVAPHIWGFIEFEHGRVFVQDARTGALVRTVELVTPAQRNAITAAQGFNMMGRIVAPIKRDKPSVGFVPVMPGLAPVATADLTTGKVTTYPAPVCKK